jgi:hypothetical protein
MLRLQHGRVEVFSMTYHQGPSPAFIRRTRNPDLPPPARFVETKKGPDDVVIGVVRRVAA